MRSIIVFVAFFHASVVSATVPSISRKLSPSAPDEAYSPELAPVPPPKRSMDTDKEPETFSPELAPVPPPKKSPGTKKEPEDGVFDVTEHGAVSDGRTESSLAFSAAWNAACDYPNPSTFYIPEGTFLVGPISFQGPCNNDRSPDIEIRGTLLAPSSLSAFESSNWIVFKDLQGFTLTGGTEKAKLDGQGAAEAWKQPSCEKSDECKKSDESLKITLSNSKGFHLGVHDSNHINIYNVTILAPQDSPNTDGIHVSHSSNVNISSSKIGVGDDCVSIGPGSKNITISKVHCGPGHGISIGSLGHYEDELDHVRWITVKNCTLTDTDNGIRIKTYQTEYSSKASGIIFQDIIMNRVRNPIIIDQEYGNSKSSQPSKVSVSDVHYININGTTTSNVAVELLCSSANPCQGIHMNNVNLKYAGPPQDDPPLSANCTNAKVSYVGLQSPLPCTVQHFVTVIH